MILQAEKLRTLKNETKVDENLIKYLNSIDLEIDKAKSLIKSQIKERVAEAE